MYIPLAKIQLALAALPLISAAPLSLSLGDNKDINTVKTLLTTPPTTNLSPDPVNNIVSGNGLTDVLTGDSITDLIKNGANVIEQVNKALGDILPNSITDKSALENVLGDIRKELSEINTLSVAYAGLLQAIISTSTPTSIPDALQRINSIVSNLKNSGATIDNIAQLLLNGLSVTDLTQNVLAGYALSPINSYNNFNNPKPNNVIYPQKARGDTPYDTPEADLRAAIYIPPTFSYGSNGAKRPILFVPGTGAFGGVNFISNLGKLLGNNPSYDPVYLNVPGAMYNDTQVNAEYIAYAINYVSSLTGNRNNLAVIAWSQGNPDTNWAFQYWPSTRKPVDDFISISADFHGTVQAYFLDPAFPDIVPLPPSIIQQEYDSNYIKTLRAGGGGSPYVPSTSIWSITDEIVQPQYSPYASAAYFTQDLPGTPDTSPTCPALTVNKNIPYTNTQVQTVCADRPAGSLYTHEGVLYNPLAYALVLDALKNPGPGRVERVDLDTVCNQLVAPGLSLADVLATEGLIPLAALNLLLYPEKVLDEPPVRQYALQANAARCQGGNGGNGGGNNGGNGGNGGNKGNGVNDGW